MSTRFPSFACILAACAASYGAFSPAWGAPGGRYVPSSATPIILSTETYRGVEIVTHAMPNDDGSCARRQNRELKKALDVSDTLKNVNQLHPPKPTRGPGELRARAPLPSKFEIFPSTDATKLQPWELNWPDLPKRVKDFTLFLKSEPSPVCNLMPAEEISKILAGLVAKMNTRPVPAQPASGVETQRVFPAALPPR